MHSITASQFALWKKAIDCRRAVVASDAGGVYDAVQRRSPAIVRPPRHRIAEIDDERVRRTMGTAVHRLPVDVGSEHFQPSRERHRHAGRSLCRSRCVHRRGVGRAAAGSREPGSSAAAARSVWRSMREIEEVMRQVEGSATGA